MEKKVDNILDMEYLLTKNIKSQYMKNKGYSNFNEVPVIVYQEFLYHFQEIFLTNDYFKKEELIKRFEKDCRYFGYHFIRYVFDNFNHLVLINGSFVEEFKLRMNSSQFKKYWINELKRLSEDDALEISLMPYEFIFKTFQ